MFEKIKQLISKDKSKKYTLNLIILLCLGILLVIMSNSILSKEEGNTRMGYSGDTEDIISANNSKDSYDDYSYKLEIELEEILSQMKGVGNVNVMITLEDSVERIPALNITQMNEKTNEKDAQGGTREVVREDLTQQIVTSNNNSPMVIKELKPKVRGVIVVAEGAENIEIKEKLYTAVKTVLGVAGNKVEIYSSK